jgi:hypothetical protein
VNKKARTQAWDSMLVKAQLHAAMCPPSASTHARALDCYGGVERATVRITQEDHDRLAVRRVAVVLALFALALFLLAIAGCVPQRAIDQLHVTMEASRKLAEDETLPVSTRLVALDNLDDAAVTLYSLTGDPLPPDVAARIERARASIAAGTSASASSIAAIDS